MESKGRPGLGDQREESALNMFRQMDLKGKVKDDTQLKTVHQNTISTVRVYEGAGGAVKKFSSMSLFPLFPSLSPNIFVSCSQRCRWKSSHLERLDPQWAAAESYVLEGYLHNNEDNLDISFMCLPDGSL